MQGRTLVVRGERLVIHGGEQSGPAVVFVHGNSLGWSCFDVSLVARLPAPWCALGIDLPGHGASPPASNPERTYCLSGYAELLLGAIARLGLGRVVLVGHSLGGHVCLGAAPRVPGLAGVVVVGTPPLQSPPRLQDAFLPHPALAHLFQEGLEEAQVTGLAAAMAVRGVPADRRVTACLRSADGRARANLASSVAAGDVNDELAIIEGLPCPVALTIGEHDQLVARAYLETTAPRNIWRGSVQVVAGAGHVPGLDAPLALRALLGEFLADLDG